MPTSRELAPARATRVFSRIDQWEYAFCQQINRGLRFRPVHGYFAVVSRLGDGYFWYALILVLPLLRPQAGVAQAISMALTGLCCTLTYKLLKHTLVRERPFISFPTIHCGTPPLDRYSFPSGHTLHAVCFSVMLFLLEPAIALATVPFTLSVAASRVVLGLHYPSDVAAGALIGTTIGLLSVLLVPPVELLDALTGLL